MPCLAVREGVGDVPIGQAHARGLGARPEPGKVDQRQLRSHVATSEVLSELRYIILRMMAFEVGVTVAVESLVKLGLLDR